MQKIPGFPCLCSITRCMALNTSERAITHASKGLVCDKFKGMARANEQLKEKLLSSGRWPDFVRRRNELRAEGKTPGEANRQAQAEFCAEGDLVKGTKPTKLRKLDVVELPKSADQTDFGLQLTEFEGRMAPIIDQVLWVARYMDVVDVPKSLCPDPAAWSLLMACRSSPVMKSDFWTKMYAKAIPSKIKEDDGDDDGNYDGKEQVSLSRALVEACGGGEGSTS